METLKKQTNIRGDVKEKNIGGDVKEIDKYRESNRQMFVETLKNIQIFVETLKKQKNIGGDGKETDTYWWRR